MIIRQHTHLGFHTSVDARQLNPISRLVSDTMRMPVQPNKAIVGSNAFSHSSGIHQDGFLKDSQTYEIIAPELVGAEKSEIILTARSGRHGLRHRLAELGFGFTEERFEELYNHFLVMADTKSEVGDEDLRELVTK